MFTKIRSTLCVLSLAAVALGLSGCTTATNLGTATSLEQTVANAVTDTLSIGLVPVLTKNPSYLTDAKVVAAALSSFAGTTITSQDVSGFLVNTSLTAADQQTIAGIVNAAWATYQKRYAAIAGAAIRPDVKLFLQAVSDGINAAVAAIPPSA